MSYRKTSYWLTYSPVISEPTLANFAEPSRIRFPVFGPTGDSARSLKHNKKQLSHASPTYIIFSSSQTVSASDL